MTSTGEEPSLRVLTLRVVRAGIDTLQGQRIHEQFPAYLHLRQRALASGSLTDIEPAWNEVGELLNMPGGPPNKPNYRPFASRNLKDPSGYWFNRNLAGSYAPSSVRSTSQFMLNPAGDGFALPSDHASQALTTFLKGTKVPAWALAAYYLRNYGFSFEGDGGYADLIVAFKQEFLFGQSSDFDILFEDEDPLLTSDWYESFVPAERQEAVDA
ncbi:hypothetical protein [Streptomyces sp. NPDC050485]|uniref:hypothetical protein n=1 Tax=Streptomyces sp. NPDC050485 TaxID=3365617 RepID=UPI00379ECBBC